MQHHYKYLFGPVPSRRLGRSLGVDIIPLKTCTQNCIYCQLGINGVQTTERSEYVNIDDVLDELNQQVLDGLSADYITISGSGEPTLHLQLGKLIDGIKKITSIPVAVITNGTLLAMPDVRIDCAKADVVLPSLDAPDAVTFEKINRPHEKLDFNNFVEGLCLFRTEYPGLIWLEVFLVDGLNTNIRQIAAFKKIIGRIRPDKIHLNTAVRPTAELDVAALSFARLEEIAGMLGENAEVIADFPGLVQQKDEQVDSEGILELLRRRPCSLQDICTGLGISPLHAGKYIGKLLSQRLIISQRTADNVFYLPKNPSKE